MAISPPSPAPAEPPPPDLAGQAGVAAESRLYVAQNRSYLAQSHSYVAQSAFYAAENELSTTHGDLSTTQAELSATQGEVTAVALRAYLAANPDSVLLEDGRVLFDLRDAQWSIRVEGRFCTVHLWSASRNLVRRIASVTPRGPLLRLASVRLGQRRSQSLELAPARAVRSPSSRDIVRRRSTTLLERVLGHAFPDWRPIGFRSATDLQHSFGPAFLRGSLVRGREAWAIVAVGTGEPQSTADGVLSVALLWLHLCREQSAGDLHYSGLRVILPTGAAATTTARMRWLNPAAAHFELYTLDQQTEDLLRVDPQDHGNSVTQLVEAPDEDAGRQRFATSIEQVLRLLPEGCAITGLLSRPAPTRSPTHEHEPRPQPARLRPAHHPHPPSPDEDPCPPPSTPGLRHPPPTTGLHPQPPSPSLRRPTPSLRQSAPSPGSPVCEIHLRSSAEVVFLCHGLPFARIRSSFAQNSFQRQNHITVGHRHEELRLTPANWAELQERIAELFRRRCASSTDSTDPLFRTASERWLESAVREDLSALDPELLPTPVYAQVPAMTGAGASLDRGMLDLLGVTRQHRLAVVEVKAQEDLHLALQGLDYWIRMREHHLTRVDSTTGLGSLQQQGYFPASRLAAIAPLLYLVAPALRIHPATETILRYLDPSVPWTLIALDERWRREVKPVWIKRSPKPR